MATLTGDFGLAAARIGTRLAAVFVLGRATARHMRALLVIGFFHQFAHSGAIGSATP
jgi:hypothetical protein